MTLARWKDLCLDASDPAAVAGFWAAALGLEPSTLDDGDVVLRGAAPEQTVWVNRVPEPKATKNRVHPDLARLPLELLVAAGGRVVRRESHAEHGWTVLTDPEGAEFCLFAEGPTALVVDSADPVTDASWWAEVLGGRLVQAPGGLRRWVGDVPGLPFEVMKFVGVEDPRTVKNRMHVDVVSDAVPVLVARGATVLREPGGSVEWHVLADPAGNEFCVFAP